MKKIFTKLTLFCSIVLTLFSATGCSQDEKQIKTLLYDTTVCKGTGIPPEVVSNAESTDFKLKNLVYHGDGKSTVEVKKKTKEECCLVFFFKTQNEFITAYVDSKEDFTIHSGGMVLFSLSGHKIPVENLDGKAEYKITFKVWNSFDMAGEKGELFVFAVKGSVNPHSILPGNQRDTKSFKASSNVLKTNFEF